MFLTLQFLEVHLNGRRYSPKPGIYCWTHLACINVLFSFRFTGKMWTELVQTVRMPVPNWRCLEDYCLILPCSHRLESNKWHVNGRMKFLTAMPMHWTPSQPESASFCRMVKWDFTMIFRWRCFQNTVYRMRRDSTDTSEKTIEDSTSQSQQSMCHKGSIKSSVFAFKNPF